MTLAVRDDVDKDVRIREIDHPREERAVCFVSRRFTRVRLEPLTHSRLKQQLRPSKFVTEIRMASRNMHTVRATLFEHLHSLLPGVENRNAEQIEILNLSRYQSQPMLQSRCRD